MTTKRSLWSEVCVGALYKGLCHTIQLAEFNSIVLDFGVVYIQMT